MTVKLLYRPEECAQALAMSRATLYQKLASGELRSVKIGRSRRIAHDELEAYVRRLSAPPEHGSAGDAPPAA